MYNDTNSEAEKPKIVTLTAAEVWSVALEAQSQHIKTLKGYEKLQSKHMKLIKKQLKLLKAMTRDQDLILSLRDYILQMSDSDEKSNLIRIFETSGIDLSPEAGGE